LLQIETINTNASFYEYNLRFVPKAIAQWQPIKPLGIEYLRKNSHTPRRIVKPDWCIGSDKAWAL
jgi:hypothetical protein